jgi:cyclophilin family peptidyl-prolyl cis-trans isomerase
MERALDFLRLLLARLAATFRINWCSIETSLSLLGSADRTGGCEIYMRAQLLILAGILGLSFLVLNPPTQAATGDGIFADFNTSRGNFTVQLDFTNTPKTVANFISLATGERAWLDWNSGQVRTNPFYNGLVFHRVVSNFVIQAGSPNGSGTDGPGYVIMDEFSPLLTHGKTGVIAMAKSGSYFNGETLPHTASSQFYITLTTNASTANLDGKYPVFGLVSSGLDVVQTIGRVAVDSSSKPLTNVTINSVTIRRIGTAAQNFNIQTNPLPLIQKVPAQFIYSNQQAIFRLSNNFPYAETRLFTSTNLTQWSADDKGTDLVPPLMTNIVQTASNAFGFYHLSRVQYPSSTWAPRHLYGQRLTLKYTYDYNGSSYQFTNSVDFDHAGTAFYQTVPASMGASDNYSYYQDIYRAYLYPIYFSGLETMELELNFTNGTGGKVVGSGYYVYPTVKMYDIGGTFSLGPSVIPGPPTLLAPAEGAVVSSFAPQFTWLQSTGATWYVWNLYRNNTNYQSQWIQATNCSATNALPPGNYYWYVQGYNYPNYGFWSPWGTFTVPPVADSPTGTGVAAGAQDYVWIADPLATSYEVLVYKGGVQFINQKFTVPQLTPVNPNRVSTHIATSHTSGSYSWWVRSVRGSVTNSWSPTMSFTIP